ncbi:MAG: PAS domain S-box protein [Victivallales bacterium]|nr:PAS domain S-box protein [Victivallales bacterium]
MDNKESKNRLNDILNSLNRITEILSVNYSTALNIIIKELAHTTGFSTATVFRKKITKDSFYPICKFNTLVADNSPIDLEVLTYSQEWLEQLNSNRYVFIKNADKYDIQQSLMTYFNKNAVRTLILYPIYFHKTLHGYIKLEDRYSDPQNIDDIDFKYLDSIANIIKSILKKKERESNFDSVEYEELLNLINDSAVIFDKEGIISKANLEYSENFNLKPEEMIGTDMRKYIPDEVYDERLKAFQKVIQTGLPHRSKEYYNGKWRKYKLYPIKNNLGEVVRIAAFTQDITELMQTINKFKKSRAKYKALFDNIKSCVAVYQPICQGKNFIFKNINKAAERVEKLNRNEIIGKTVTEVFPGIKEFALFNVLKRVYKTGQPEELPSRLYQDDRISGWRSNYVYKLDTGEIVSVYKDITELKEKGKELLESKKYLELAIKGTGAGIWERDLKNDVFKCNGNFAEMLGYEHDELNDEQKIIGLCHPHDRKIIKKMLKQYIADETELYENELRFLHKKGHWVWVLARGSIVEWDNCEKPLTLAGTFIDISKIKAYQAERDKYLQRMEKILNEAVGAIRKAVEIRDSYTAGHQDNVANLSILIAEEMNYNKDNIKKIEIAAKLHDIGKIYIPDEILNKPGKLSPDEYEIIKTHVDKGYYLLKTILLPNNVPEIIRQHHERLDGSGYPKGIKKGLILPESSILAVADVVEAMISDRPYRRALSIDTAISEIKGNSGILYDERVVDACIKVLKKENISSARSLGRPASSDKGSYAQESDKPKS